MVADSRKVTDTAATHKHDGVLLKVVPFSRDISRHFDPVRKANTCHLTQGRIRLLGRHNLDLKTNSLFLRAAMEGWMFRSPILLSAGLPHELVNCRHSLLPVTQSLLKQAASLAGILAKS